jgi:putative transcriptional regulator
MVEILRNKNLATKLQILAEIANSGPHIQQKDIAQKLGVTPQAISDYAGQLVKDGFLIIDKHAKYKITNQGVNWIIKELKELKDYSNFIVEAITNISVSTAIADSPLVKGQKVGLKMKNGLLAATAEADSGAKGIAVSGAQAGEDAGIQDIEGIVELKSGKVTIIKIPNTQRGGSRRVDPAEIRARLKDRQFVAAIGIEAYVTLKKANIDFFQFFGAKEGVIESAQHGLSPAAACVEDEISSLIKGLEEANLVYEIVNTRVKKGQ